MAQIDDSSSSARSGLVLGMARVFGLGLSLIATMLLIRGIGISGYGRFTVAMTAVTLLVGAVDLGLGTLANRDVPVATDKDGLIRSLWEIRSRANIVVLGVGLAVGIVCWVEGSGTLGLEIVAVGVSGAYILGGNLATAIGFAQGLGKRQAVLELVSKVGWVLAAGAIAIVGGGWMGALAASVGLGGIPLIARKWLGNNPRSVEHQDRAGGALRRAVPLSLFALIYLAFNRADVMGLAIGTSAREVGRYATSYRFADAMLGLGVAAVAIIAPTLASRTTRRERHERARDRVMRVSGWLSGLGMAGAPIWLRILAGNQIGALTEAMGTVMLLGVGSVAYIGMQIDLVGLIAARRHWGMMMVVGMASVAEGVGVWAVAHWGIMAAAGVVCFIELGAVGFTSMLCAKSDLKPGWLRAGWLGLGVGIVVSGGEILAGAGVVSGLIGAILVSAVSLSFVSTRNELRSIFRMLKSSSAK